VKSVDGGPGNLAAVDDSNRLGRDSRRLLDCWLRTQMECLIFIFQTAGIGGATDICDLAKHNRRRVAGFKFHRIDNLRPKLAAQLTLVLSQCRNHGAVLA